MKNITKTFEEIYVPKKALVIYELKKNHDNAYVESFDIDEKGAPCNGHPLSETECEELSACLALASRPKGHYLQASGLMPRNILSIGTYHAIWHTPEMSISLLFKKELGIPCGKASVPPLLWKATKSILTLFAINGEITEEAPLHHAPFFNISKDGGVCMGTVSAEIDEHSDLQNFMSSWEHYFFDSFFSHMVAGHLPVKGNMVQLWKDQVQKQPPSRGKR